MSSNFPKTVLSRAVNPLGADAATIERFIAQCHRRKYPSRTDIFNPGDPANTLYFIISGSVSIIARESDDRELVLGYIGPGEFIGEMGLFVHQTSRGVILRTRVKCRIAEITYARIDPVARTMRPAAQAVAARQGFQAKLASSAYPSSASSY